jgi:nucleolar complex protein 2
MRVKKTQAAAQTYRVALWLEALYLLTQHLATHSHTIGFPESFWAVATTLRKLRQDVKVPKVQSLICSILRGIDATAKSIAAKREKVSFGPCDVNGVKQFEDEVKSAGTPLMQLHTQLREQRLALFKAKQRNLSERTTLESVVQRRKPTRGAKRQRGSDEE